MIKSIISSLHLKVLLPIGVLSIVFFSTFAEGKPLKIEVNKVTKEPLNISIPSFISDSGLRELSENIVAVITDDLVSTGLFVVTENTNYLSFITDFNNPIDYPAWNAIKARALLTGELSSNGTTGITVKFRLFDVLSEKPFKEGLKLTGPRQGWRRIAHKIADEVYARITGENKYFDSRIAFVAEEGSKENRTKRLAIMDYDGANQAFLTEKSDFIVLSPKFSPNGSKLLFTSYETGSPRICLLDIRSRKKIFLEGEPETMSFSPSFSPNGKDVVFSLTSRSNTDIYSLNIASNTRSRLTSSISIDTSPSFSPDGRRLVFESDRSGTQQLYVMPSSGGNAKRISFGQGSYGAPVWSPDQKLIAFTKQNKGSFYIGIMNTDGSNERLLTSSFLDESPSWSPNGRVIIFSRSTSGSGSSSTLYSIDIARGSLKPIRASSSDPSWSNLLN